MFATRARPRCQESVSKTVLAGSLDTPTPQRMPIEGGREGGRDKDGLAHFSMEPPAASSTNSSRCGEGVGSPSTSMAVRELQREC